MIVYKYSLLKQGLLEENIQLAIPADAKILKVDLQGTTPQMWVMTDIPTIDGVLVEKVCKLRVVATGQKFDATNLNFLGTLVFGSNGSFVFHVFEVMGD